MSALEDVRAGLLAEIEQHEATIDDLVMGLYLRLAQRDDIRRAPNMRALERIDGLKRRVEVLRLVDSKLDAAAEAFEAKWAADAAREEAKRPAREAEAEKERQRQLKSNARDARARLDKALNDEHGTWWPGMYERDVAAIKASAEAGDSFDAWFLKQLPARMAEAERLRGLNAQQDQSKGA